MQRFARLISRRERQPAGSYRLPEAVSPFLWTMMKMEKTKGAMTRKSAGNRKKKFWKKKNKFWKKKKTPVAKNGRMAQEKIGVYVSDDIVSEILLRLPARSVGKFRCVSKSWLSITSNTPFARANAKHNRITRHSLIVGDLILRRELFSVFADENSESAIRFHHYRPMESMSEDSFLIASCDGLVCLGCFEDLYYLFNPLTGYSTALPIDSVDLTHKLGFYFHCPTSKYRLIRFTATTHESDVLVVGESSWRRIPGNFPAFFHSPHPLELDGHLYWLAHSRNNDPFYVPPDTVVIFDEEQEVFSVSSPPPLEKHRDLGGNLFDFNGKLGIWVVSKDITIDVWIMENVWIKRYSVKCGCIHGNPLQLTCRWFLGRAITFGDEQLLLHLTGVETQHYLVRCNLASGACVGQIVASHLTNSSFQYTETLTNPEYSAST